MKNKNIPVGIIALIILWFWSVIITDKYVSTIPTENIKQDVFNTPSTIHTSHDSQQKSGTQTTPQ